MFGLNANEKTFSDPGSGFFKLLVQLEDQLKNVLWFEESPNMWFITKKQDIDFFVLGGNFFSRSKHCVRSGQEKFPTIG